MLPLAEEGDVDAQTALARRYWRRKRTGEDKTKKPDNLIAFKWYKRAAEQGDAEGQFYLGVLYYQGYGIPKDLQETVRLHKRSANQGYASAQESLAIRYEKGEGVEKNLVEALKWSNLNIWTLDRENSISGKETDPIYKHFRNRLIKKMTPSQIAEAQRLYEEFKPKKERTKFKKPNSPKKVKSTEGKKPILLLPQLLLAESFAGKCIGISDGDTISVLRNQQSVRVRLEGIDSPEKGQNFSSVATKFTSNLAFGQEVSVQIKDHDRYGRIVGRVSVGEKDLSTELVKAGLAWHYKQYSLDKTLANAENQARNIKVGLWSLPNPKPPWNIGCKGE